MRAILSVYDKTGITELAQGLHDLGWELFSTGRTQAAIAEAGVPVESIATMTGSPEMLEGRVKTLHPKVHGGLLARRDREDDAAELAEHGIEPVDLVAGNLYPFIETVSGTDVSLAEALEEIDIGGPTMIRAAAKNHPWVIPVVDPSDYEMILEALRAGGLDAGARRALAAKAFAHVSHYDAAIAEYLRGEDDLLPEQLTLAMTRVEVMRYGENPHQRGAFYALDSVRTPVEGIGGFEQHHGQGMSYVNFLDADAAFNLVCDVEGAAVAIIKHTNPACFAAGGGGDALAPLYERALAEGDYVSAYGGIVAVNRPIDFGMADALRQVRNPESGVRMRYDIVIAPGYTEDGLEHLKKKSRDLRILEAPPGEPRRERVEARGIRGAMLLQTADVSEETAFEITSERKPSEAELEDLGLAWVVCKHVKSNAVVFVKDGVLIGMGAGQPNRVGSARLCQQQAGERARGAVAATDAFIPFPDTVEVCAEAGCTVIAHTGGSIRDEDSIEAANRLGVSLVATGARHFRH